MAHHHEIKVPKIAIVCAVALLSLTVFVAVTGDHGGIVTEKATPATRVVDEMTLMFRDRDIGGVDVVHARTMRVISVFEPGTNSFARGVLRSMAQEREVREIDRRLPFVLRRFADGRLTLSDPGTGRVIELISFGRDNVQVFADFLTKKESRS